MTAPAIGKFTAGVHSNTRTDLILRAVRPRGGDTVTLIFLLSFLRIKSTRIYSLGHLCWTTIRSGGSSNFRAFLRTGISRCHVQTLDVGSEDQVELPSQKYCRCPLLTRFQVIEK